MWFRVGNGGGGRRRWGPGYGGYGGYGGGGGFMLGIRARLSALPRWLAVKVVLASILPVLLIVGIIITVLVLAMTHKNEVEEGGA